MQKVGLCTAMFLTTGLVGVKAAREYAIAHDMIKPTA